MYNQQPKTFPSSFSIDLKTKYKQRLDINMTVIQPSPQNFSIPITNYDAITKENSSPTKRYNLSTDKMQENGISIKNRFEQIKKKYDNQAKQIKPQAITFQRNPLVETNKMNFPSQLSARTNERKVSVNNPKLADYSFIEKINQEGRYQKLTDYKVQLDNEEQRYAFNHKVPSQEKYLASSKQKNVLNTTFSKQNLYKYKFFNQPTMNPNSQQKIEKDEVPQHLNKTIDYSTPQKIEQQQKIQSIDKINQKIDKIMRCIKNDINCEKKVENNVTPRPYSGAPKIYETTIPASNSQTKYAETNLTNNYSNNKNYSNQIYINISKPNEVKDYSAKRYSINNLKNYEEIANNKPIYSFMQEKNEYKTPENINQNISMNVPEIKVSEFTRSSSLIPKTSTRDALILPKNQVPQSNKSGNDNDLDEQIKKIHQKIKKSEQQKKKLNIKFQTFMKPKDLNKQSPSKNKIEKIQKQTYELPKPQKNIGGNKTLITPTTKYEYMYKDEEPVPKRLEKNTKLYSFEKEENTSGSKNNNNNHNPERISKFNPEIDSHFLRPYENTITNFSRQVGDQSIIIESIVKQKDSKPTIPNLKLSNNVEQRESSPIARITCSKEKEQATHFSGRNYQRDIIRSQIFQSKETIETFKKQMTFDQSFRDGKLTFSNNKNPEKWKKLKSELQTNQIHMNENGLKNEFDITPEELDPFHSSRQGGQTIQNLVKRYKQSINHWNCNIRNKFTVDTLENEGFRQENIDLQKKGYITIEDLVRFMNLQTGTFYRNRDFILCFRRITKNSKITYKELLKVISC